ncbi:nucleotidyltransferase family protein [Balneolales bacterium ANBcel1]|nr:nucleotidyltransferase family protein [Balneolales bacterium ANBcel1]
MMDKVFLDVLHQDPGRYPETRLNGLDAAGREQLFQLAVEHRVVPLLHQRLAPEHGREHLAPYVREVARNNLRFFAELDAYLGELEKAGIPVILLKGIWLAHEVYPGMGMREMNDMDLMFHADHLPEALRLAESLGYHADLPVRVDEQVRRSHHLAPLMKKGVAVLELHWNITRPGRSYYIDPEPLWERAESITVNGKPAMVLCPIDRLLHLCLHTSYQHLFSFGLRPFCDIAAVIRHDRERLDWMTLVQRAKAYRWDKGVWMALSMARELTGAEVPEDVLESLQPKNGPDPAEIRQIAMEQLFTEKQLAASVPPTLAEAIRQNRIRDKIRTIWSQVFPSQERMAGLYPVRPGSPWMWYYYLDRFGRLMATYALRTIRIYRGDKTLTGIVDRKNRLRDWMME